MTCRPIFRGATYRTRDFYCSPAVRNDASPSNPCRVLSQAMVPPPNIEESVSTYRGAIGKGVLLFEVLSIEGVGGWYVLLSSIGRLLGVDDGGTGVIPQCCDAVGEVVAREHLSSVEENENGRLGAATTGILGLVFMAPYTMEVLHSRVGIPEGNLPDVIGRTIIHNEYFREFLGLCEKVFECEGEEMGTIMTEHNRCGT